MSWTFTTTVARCRSPTSSLAVMSPLNHSDRAVATLPVLRPQRLLVRLAETGKRQRVGEQDLLRRVHGPLALLDGVLDLRRDLLPGHAVVRGPGAQDDDGRDS